MPRTTYVQHLFSGALFCIHPQPRSSFPLYCKNQHVTVQTTPWQTGSTHAVALRISTSMLQDLCYDPMWNAQRDTIQRSQIVHLAWNTTSEDQFSLLTQRGIYGVKMHKHTNIIQVRHQSPLLKGYFWWGVPGAFMPLENCLLMLREKRCLLEGLQNPQHLPSALT